MLLKGLTITPFTLTLTGNVYAQEAPRACGDFAFSGQDRPRVAAAEIMKDLRICNVFVLNASIDGNLMWLGAIIEHRLTFRDVRITGTTDFSETAFKSETVFRGTTFEGDADFSNTAFQGQADFFDTTFEGDVNFSKARFLEGARFANVEFATNFARFDEVSFRRDAEFSGTQFLKGGSFRATAFDGNFDLRGIRVEGGNLDFSLAEFGGDIRPPSFTVTGSLSGLTFAQVGDTVTCGVAGFWEEYFRQTGEFDGAEASAKVSKRCRLLPWFVRLGIGFGGVWSAFGLIYFVSFWRIQKKADYKGLWRIALFSLDVLSPGIGPWKYDWVTRGKLPVHDVAFFTAVEAGVGWLLLTVLGALVVAFFIF